MPQAEAEALIAGANLTVGTITGEYMLSAPTGIVSYQNPGSLAEVPPLSNIDLTVVQPPPVAEIIPEEWAGEWQITLTFRNAESGDITGAQGTSNVLCPGDPLGVALLEAMVSEDPSDCSGTATESQIDVSCSSQVAYEACLLDVTLQFTIDLSDDTMTGVGEWMAVGDCGLLVPVNEGETITISGVRLGTDLTKCDSPTSSFFQKFVRHQLLRAIEEVYHAD
jgi:hypothetical protein